MSFSRILDQEHIYMRKNPSGKLVYVVRISCSNEPTGLWFNQTYQDLETAIRVRDKRVAMYFLEKQSKLDISF
jgi:hypothetical protein